MINLPANFTPSTTKGFRELIEFFNELEIALQYPNCEGYEEQKRVLQKAEHDLIMWGKI